MINAVVTGNLGQDAELKITANGDVLCNFSVASNAKVKGEKVTTWVKCTMWGKRAEAISKYLTRGTRVAVVGEFSTNEYNSKTYFNLNVQQVDLMGGGRRDDDSESNTPTTLKDKQTPKGSAEYDDDPF